MGKIINAITGEDFFPKQPWEEITIEIDFTNDLASGDTIASISSNIVTDIHSGDDVTSTMLPNTPTISGTKVYPKIKAGTNHHRYNLSLKCITIDGDKVEGDIRIEVEEIS